MSQTASLISDSTKFYRISIFIDHIRLNQRKEFQILYTYTYPVCTIQYRKKPNMDIFYVVFCYCQKACSAKSLSFRRNFAGMQLQTEAVLLRQTSGIYIYSFLPISTTRCVLIKMLKKQILLSFQEEVIQLILSYLDIPSLCMASVTSKQVIDLEVKGHSMI